MSSFEPHPPEHVLYLERSPRRVRVLVGEQAVADSDDVRLLHPPGRTPTYLFPREHVRIESERLQADAGMGPTVSTPSIAAPPRPTRLHSLGHLGG